MEKKIEELTEVEIKSLLYDQIIAIEIAKSYINVLQKELSGRANNIQEKE